MTAIALIIGFGIGWLICPIIMRRAYKNNPDRHRKIYRSYYDRAVRHEHKSSKNKPMKGEIYGR